LLSPTPNGLRVCFDAGVHFATALISLLEHGLALPALMYQAIVSHIFFSSLGTAAAG
jgi:hypothetical protein